jgi:6-phosphogluconolactonase (cycloisomerase 2 family)
MHQALRRSALSAILFSLLAASAASVSAASPNAVAGYVYVNNNASPNNNIAGFARHRDGTLTPLAGSPFPTGGAGVGSPVGSAGAIQFSRDRRFVLAVDAASNDISVMRVGKDGSLSLVGMTGSNGTTPLSIAVHDDLVYVANAGAGGSDYTGFRLDHRGHLTPIPNSTVALPDSAMPGQVLFSGDGKTLAGTRVGPAAGPSYIDSFRVGDDGRLTAAPGSPFLSPRTGPFGSEFRPTNPQQLFVSNAHDGAGAGSVSAYTVAKNAALTPVSGSPFADGQTAPCWVEISHDGKYLFAINTGSSSISRYWIAKNGAMTLLGSTPFKNPTGLRPFDARLDPSGHFLYVVDAGAKAVSVFSVHGGNLAELASSPVSIPGGVAPFGIIVR